MVRVHRQRIGQVVPSGRDLLPDGLGVHEGKARHRAVRPIDTDASVIAEAFGESALDSSRGVVLLIARLPVSVAVADEAVPNREEIFIFRYKHRVGISCRFVNRGEQALAGQDGKDSDRRCVAEQPPSLRDVCVHVELGVLSERVVEVEDCVLLFVASGVPPDVAVGESAAFVTRVDPRRVAERSGIAERRVAFAERNASQFALAPVEDVNGVAAATHVFRLGETSVPRPLRTAVLAGAADDLLAVENVDAEGQVSVGPDLAAPYDTALARVAAVAARQPGDSAHVEAVKIIPQHEVECATYSGVAVERPQALCSQHFNAFDRRERDRVQIVRSRRVGPTVHQDEQVAPSGEEVADNARVKHLAKRLSTGPLNEAAVVLGDDLRVRGKRVGLD